MWESVSKFSDQNMEPERTTHESVEDVATRILNDLGCKQVTLLNITLLLEPYLTSESPNEREKGIRVIAHVLKANDTFYNVKELEELCAFLCARFNDDIIIIPSLLETFVALTKHHLNVNSVFRIIEELQSQMIYKSYKPKERFQVYKILLENLPNLIPPGEEKLKNEYVDAVIGAIDSERDPANLLLILSHMPRFFQNFLPTNLTEDGFDLIACYFPIDYVNASNSKFSRDDFVELLEKCLSAIAAFAPFVFPLALEKLASDLPVAQFDAVKLMIACFNNFPPSTTKPFANECLSKVFDRASRCLDSRVQDKCFEALSKIIDHIALDWNTIISDTTLTELLIKPAKKTMPMYSRLVVCAAQNPVVCEFIVTNILPQLIHEIKQNPSLDLFYCIESVFTKAYDGDLAVDKKLRNTIIDCYLEFINRDNFELRAQCFVTFAKLFRHWYPGDNYFKFNIVSVLSNILIKEPNVVVRIAIADLMREFSACARDDFRQYFLSSDAYFKLEDEPLARFLEIILQVTNDHFEIIMSRVLPMLLSKQHQKYSFALKNIIVDERFATEFMRNVQTHDTFYKLTDLLYLHRENIFDCRSFEFPSSTCTCSLVSEDMQFILRSLKPNKDILKEVSRLLSLYGSSKKSPYDLVHFLLILDAYLHDVPPNVIADSEELQLQLLNEFFLIADMNVQHSRDAYKLIVQILYCTKSSNVDKKIINRFDEFFLQPASKINITNASEILRVLILSNHRKAESYLKTMLGMLSKPYTTNTLVCLINIFPVVLSFIPGKQDDENRLKNCLDLNQQKFSNLVINYLDEFLTAKNSSEKDIELLRNHHEAMVFFISKMPSELFLIYHKKLNRHILDCLSQKFHWLNQTWIISVENLLNLITFDKKTFDVSVAANLQDYLPTLIDLVNNTESMKIRLGAVTCLGKLLQYPKHLIVPYHSRVVKTLKNCSYDHKRIVRSLVASVRCQWMMST